MNRPASKTGQNIHMVREKVHMEGKKERTHRVKKKEVNIERRYTEKGYTQRGGTHGGKQMEIHKKGGRGGTLGEEKEEVHTDGKK